MLTSNPEQIQRHIKTHTDRSAMDEAAVSILKTFLRSNGRINTNFASNDKWPNTDGTFEFVTNPTIYKKLKISLLLNTLNSLKLKNRLDSDLPTVIVWKLPKSMMKL